MKIEREILKNHFGDYYPKLEKWKYFNHILNAMNDIANIGSTKDMLKQCCPNDELDFNQEAQFTYKKIIDQLNLIAGKKFKYVNAHKRLIEARMMEGYLLEDFYTVIAFKTKEWKGTDNEKYLRPSTLFNASKFDGYLNNINNSNATGDDNFEFEPSDKPDLT